MSVVVASYNHARFIENCLKSILTQTLLPAELIVIDDGSKDDSPAIITRTLESATIPCDLIVRKNRGLCATLNQGFARAKGEYFGYLGSDDLWLPDFLAERVKLLELRPNAVLGYGHCFLIDEDDRIVDSTADWANYSDGSAIAMLLKTIAPMSPTVLYRRSCLDAEPWRIDSRLEDYDLYLRLANRGEFAFDPRVLSAWRHHSTNTSHNQQMMLNEQLAALRRAAAELGLSQAELDKIEKETRFRRADDFLRYGEKRIAIGLMAANLRGVKLSSSLFKMILRLIVPYSMMERRKRMKSSSRNERYGTVRSKMRY